MAELYNTCRPGSDPLLATIGIHVESRPVAIGGESLLGLSLDFGAAHPVILKELLASGYLSPLIAELK